MRNENRKTWLSFFILGWWLTSVNSYIMKPIQLSFRYHPLPFFTTSPSSSPSHLMTLAVLPQDSSNDEWSKTNHDDDPLNTHMTMARGIKDAKSTKNNNNNKGGGKGLGGYDPYEDLRGSEVVVGDPQIKLKEKERSVTSILAELAAIQQQGPQKYCILGTRHCSYLHQQIIELLAYALVLSGNHVYTSGAGGTNAATIKGALRAERPDLLTVVIPQSMNRQTKESQELLKQVQDVVAMPQNDDLSLDVASKICNSYLLSLTDQLISFAFHESNTVIEATKEAKKLNKLVTVLYLD